MLGWVPFWRWEVIQSQMTGLRIHIDRLPTTIAASNAALWIQGGSRSGLTSPRARPRRDVSIYRTVSRYDSVCEAAVGLWAYVARRRPGADSRDRKSVV